jgi:hypothetical protein
MIKKNKTSIPFLAILLLVLTLSVSCNKEEIDEITKSTKTAIIKFKINDVEGAITGESIAITLPIGTDAASISGKVTLSDGATIDPDPTTTADYSNPKEFTVTAEDGTTTKKYTVTVTIAAIAPTEENPYPEGVFVLKAPQVGNYELDFRHSSGKMDTEVFQKANNGQKINGFSITDIIPHKKGYLIFSNLDNGTGGKLYFTDLKLKITKELDIEKSNVVSGNYAQIDNSIYYTNVSNIVEVNQPENKTYIIDTEAQTLKEVDKQILQFFATSTNELYYLDIIRQLNKVTDKTTLAAQKVEDFDDYSTSFVLDNEDKLWSISATKYPQDFAEVLEQGRGTFNYKLNMVCYDIGSNTKYEGTSAEDINRDSQLFVKSNKVYMITNQNTHIQNAKKQLEELHMDGNTIKLQSRYELPKLNNSGLKITRDIAAFDLMGSSVMVFGSGDVSPSNGLGTYYYDLDVSNGTVSDKTLGIYKIFQRKASQ